MQKTQQAYKHLLATLLEADNSFLDEKHMLDEQGKVDGYRHLLDLFAYGVDFYVNNDPLNPNWARLATPYRKILGDNVDSVYHFSQLQAGQRYRIRGWRHNSVYQSFAVYAGKPDGTASDHVSITVNHNEIEYGDDGGFEIYFTSDPKEKNEFKLDDDAICIISREYFSDPVAGMEAELYIDNMSDNPSPMPLSDEQLATRINTLSNFIESTLQIVPFPIPLPQNGFSPAFFFPKEQKSWGLTDNAYCFGRFEIQDDEYLELRFSSPPAVYWGVQVWNHMMQSMDYVHHKVSINMNQAKPNKDGSFTIKVSKAHMDDTNWFSTGGYNSGVIFCRWLLPDGMPEQPVMELKKIGS